MVPRGKAKRKSEPAWLLARSRRRILAERRQSARHRNPSESSRWMSWPVADGVGERAPSWPERMGTASRQWHRDQRRRRRAEVGFADLVGQKVESRLVRIESRQEQVQC